MYAIIRAGGKQAKVREGDVIDVERIKTPTPRSPSPRCSSSQDDGTVISERSRSRQDEGDRRGPR